MLRLRCHTDLLHETRSPGSSEPGRARCSFLRRAGGLGAIAHPVMDDRENAAEEQGEDDEGGGEASGVEEKIVSGEQDRYDPREDGGEADVRADDLQLVFGHEMLLRGAQLHL